MCNTAKRSYHYYWLFVIAESDEFQEWRRLHMFCMAPIPGLKLMLAKSLIFETSVKWSQPLFSRPGTVFPSWLWVKCIIVFEDMCKASWLGLDDYDTEASEGSGHSSLSKCVVYSCKLIKLAISGNSVVRHALMVQPSFDCEIQFWSLSFGCVYVDIDLNWMFWSLKVLRSIWYSNYT